MNLVMDNGHDQHHGEYNLVDKDVSPIHYRMVEAGHDINSAAVCETQLLSHSMQEDITED